MYAALPLIRNQPETLPDWIVTRHKLIPHAQAVESIHFPESAKALEAARARLGFEEVFGLTLAALLNKNELMQDEAIAMPFHEKLAQDFVKHLPFKLTDAQRKVTWQILQNMEQKRLMNRLVDGDVGSGKTVVATMAAVMSLKAGFKTAIMYSR